MTDAYAVEIIAQHVHNAKHAIAAKLNEYAEKGYRLYNIYSIAASTPEYFNVIIVFIKGTLTQQPPAFAMPQLPVAIPMPTLPMPPYDTPGNPNGILQAD